MAAHSATQGWAVRVVKARRVNLVLSKETGAKRRMKAEDLRTRRRRNLKMEVVLVFFPGRAPWGTRVKLASAGWMVLDQASEEAEP
mmetsp:Transcript_87629/g.155415  ORF Transcript_87629/g.155415 Transcript_87629/m.155415 type:complete len:86 (+) Transcript_87629:173-430(+)